LEQKISASEQEKLKWEESETVRNLFKNQNSLLGDYLEALDPFAKNYQSPKFRPNQQGHGRKVAVHFIFKIFFFFPI
jgi:hypothetical protein